MLWPVNPARGDLWIEDEPIKLIYVCQRRGGIGMGKFAVSCRAADKQKWTGMVRAYPQVTPSRVWNDVLNNLNVRDPIASRSAEKPRRAFGIFALQRVNT